jgi:DNA topoisomerase-1
LTRKFDEEMDLVFNGKKKREEVVEEAKETLTDILKEFKDNEKKIGKKLSEGLVEARAEERLLGTCPNCKTGELRVMFSRFTKKRFVGCSSYFKCAKCGFTRPACKCKCEICGQPKGKCKCSWKEKKWYPSCQTGFPLPAVGLITSMNKTCEVCGYPMIQVWRKGSRPFRMCINHKCKTKENWGKPKDKTKQKKVKSKSG